jgi:hypothetical protein
VFEGFERKRGGMGFLLETIFHTPDPSASGGVHPRRRCKPANDCLLKVLVNTVSTTELKTDLKTGSRGVAHDLIQQEPSRAFVDSRTFDPRRTGCGQSLRCKLNSTPRRKQCRSLQL